jgi:hypothetical protein
VDVVAGDDDGVADLGVLDEAAVFLKCDDESVYLACDLERVGIVDQPRELVGVRGVELDSDMDILHSNIARTQYGARSMSSAMRHDRRPGDVERGRQRVGIG